MRKRDVVFAWVAWGGLLAGLAWALSTQARWVRENQPIEVKRTPLESVEPGPPPTATGVIGTVTEDTRTSLAKGLAQGKAPQSVPARRPPEPPGRRPQP